MSLLGALVAGALIPSTVTADGITTLNERAIEVARVTASGGVTNDYLGYASAADGDIAVVGAYGTDIGGAANVGAAYVFRLHEDGSVTHLATLTASDRAGSDEFGWSVAISGDTIVVGARGVEDLVGADRGAAYVFAKPPGGWASATETARLTSSNSADYDQLGTSVAVGPDTVAVGAPRRSSGGQAQAGAAYTFNKPVGGWVSTSTANQIFTSGVGAPTFFGTALAISGNTLAVGAPFDRNPATDSGSIYVYTRSGTGAAWSYSQTLGPAGPESSEELGSSVAIDGDTILGGAPGATGGGVGGAGRAYLFTRTSSTFSRVGTLTASTAPNVNDEFGWSVALSGDRAVVGARFADPGNLVNAGAAFFFTKPTGGWTGGLTGQEIVSSAAQAGDRAGSSVAIGTSSIWIGAPQPNGVGQGAVDVFDVARAPDPPTAPSATPGTEQVTASWSAPANDGGSAITSYTATASPGGGTCTATAPSTSCTITGLTGGTAYTVSVTASNAAGTSTASSASAQVTPTSAPAPAPTPSPAPAPAVAPQVAPAPAAPVAPVSPCASLSGVALATCEGNSSRTAAIDEAKEKRTKALEACRTLRAKAARARCTATAGAAYQQAVARSGALRTRDIALARCEAKSGRAKSLCTTTAQAAYRRSLSRASAAYSYARARAACTATRGERRTRCLRTASARRSYGLAVASARYARTVANQRCLAKTGAARVACRQAASARYAAATSRAKAQRALRLNR